MYTINYKNNEILSITKKIDNIETTFSDNNAEYKQYLIDVENGAEVIDNAPTTEGLIITAQAEKIAAIDSKTQSLIYAGFGHGTIMLSMSDSAQINFLGLQSMAAGLTFPYSMTTLNDTKYFVESVEELQTIISNAFAHKETAIKSGQDLKELVLDAATIDEVSLILDER